MRSAVEGSSVLAVAGLVATFGASLAGCEFDPIDKEGRRCDTSCAPLYCVDHVCRTTPPEDGGTARDAGTPGDGDALDGGAPDAGGDGPPAPVNLLENGTFEGGCGPWSGSSVSTVLGGRTGRACRVCFDGLVTNFDTLESGPQSLTTGESYLVTYWVKADPAQAPPSVFGALRAVNRPFTIVERVDAPPMSLTSDWQEYRIAITLKQPADYLNTYLAADPGPGCFLVDDVVLLRQ